MPTLEIDGMRFIGTHEECAAFVRSLRQPVPGMTSSAPASTMFLNNQATWPLPFMKAAGEREHAVASIEVMALAFLRELKGKAEGLESETVQRLVGASHPKGIGSKIGMINNCLLAHGFKEPETVFTSVRHPTEGRRWFPGPAITDAILILERSEAGRSTTRKVA